MASELIFNKINTDKQEEHLSVEELETALKGDFLDDSKECHTFIEELENNDKNKEIVKAGLEKSIIVIKNKHNNIFDAGNLTETELKIIQLRANVNFYADMKIDGKRDSELLPYLGIIEASYKSENILKLLHMVDSEQDKLEIIQKFAKYYNPIRIKGSSFADKIPSKNYRQLFNLVVDYQLYGKSETKELLDTSGENFMNIVDIEHKKDLIKAFEIHSKQFVKDSKKRSENLKNILKEQKSVGDRTDKLGKEIDKEKAKGNNNRVIMEENYNTLQSNYNSFRTKITNAEKKQRAGKEEYYKKILKVVNGIGEQSTKDQIYQQIISEYNNDKKTIDRNFGSKLHPELQDYQNRMSNKYFSEGTEELEKLGKGISVHDEMHDVNSQFESKESTRFSHRISRTEYKKSFPYEAEVLRGKIGDRFRKENPTERALHIPNTIYKLHIAGGGTIVTKIKGSPTFKRKSGEQLVVLNTKIGYQRSKYKGLILGPEHFALASKDKNGNMLLRKLDGSVYKKYSTEKIQKGQTSYEQSSEIFYSNEVQEANKQLQKIGHHQNNLQKLHSKFEGKGVDKYEVNDARILAYELKDMHINLEDWKKARTTLFKLVKNIKPGSIETAEEKRINQQIKNLNIIIDQFSGEGITNFINVFTNDKTFNENNTGLKKAMLWFKNDGLKTVGAIIVAVVLTVLTGVGGGGFLATTLAGTAGGMAGMRGGTILNEYLQNFDMETIVVNGIERKIRFDDPTDFELLMDEKISGSDLVTNLAFEFVTGAIMQGGAISALRRSQLKTLSYTAKHPNTALTKSLKFFKPSFFKGLETPQMTNAMQSVTKSSGFQKFQRFMSQKLGKEVGEELYEESVQTAMQKAGEYMGKGMSDDDKMSQTLGGAFGSLLSYVAMFATFRPGSNVGKFFAQSQVSMGEVDFDESSSLLIQNMEYNAENSETVKNFFEMRNFAVEENNGEIVCTINDIGINGLPIKQQIILNPSTAPYNFRSNTVFKQYGLKRDEEKNNYNIPTLNQTQLDQFKKDLEKQKMFRVFDDQNGNWTIFSEQEELVLNVNKQGELFSGKTDVDLLPGLNKDINILQNKTQIEENSQFMTTNPQKAFQKIIADKNKQFQNRIIQDSEIQAEVEKTHKSGKLFDDTQKGIHTRKLWLLVQEKYIEKGLSSNSASFKAKEFVKYMTDRGYCGMANASISQNNQMNTKMPAKNTFFETKKIDIIKDKENLFQNILRVDNKDEQKVLIFQVMQHSLLDGFKLMTQANLNKKEVLNYLFTDKQMILKHPGFIRELQDHILKYLDFDGNRLSMVNKETVAGFDKQRITQLINNYFSERDFIIDGGNISREGVEYALDDKTNFSIFDRVSLSSKAQKTQEEIVGFYSNIFTQTHKKFIGTEKHPLENLSETDQIIHSYFSTLEDYKNNNLNIYDPNGLVSGRKAAAEDAIKKRLEQKLGKEYSVKRDYENLNWKIQERKKDKKSKIFDLYFHDWEINDAMLTRPDTQIFVGEQSNNIRIIAKSTTDGLFYLYADGKKIGSGKEASDEITVLPGGGEYSDFIAVFDEESGEKKLYTGSFDGLKKIDKKYGLRILKYNRDANNKRLDLALPVYDKKTGKHKLLFDGSYTGIYNETYPTDLEKDKFFLGKSRGQVIYQSGDRISIGEGKDIYVLFVQDKGEKIINFEQTKELNLHWTVEDIDGNQTMYVSSVNNNYENYEQIVHANKIENYRYLNGKHYIKSQDGQEKYLSVNGQYLFRGEPFEDFVFMENGGATCVYYGSGKDNYDKIAMYNTSGQFLFRTDINSNVLFVTKTKDGKFSYISKDQNGQVSLWKNYEKIKDIDISDDFNVIDLEVVGEKIYIFGYDASTGKNQIYLDGKLLDTSVHVGFEQEIGGNKDNIFYSNIKKIGNDVFSIQNTDKYTTIYKNGEVVKQINQNERSLTKIDVLGDKGFLTIKEGDSYSIYNISTGLRVAPSFQGKIVNISNIGQDYSVVINNEQTIYKMQLNLEEEIAAELDLLNEVSKDFNNISIKDIEEFQKKDKSLRNNYYDLKNEEGGVNEDGTAFSKKELIDMRHAASINLSRVSPEILAENLLQTSAADNVKQDNAFARMFVDYLAPEWNDGASSIEIDKSLQLQNNSIAAQSSLSPNTESKSTEHMGGNPTDPNAADVMEISKDIHQLLITELTGLNPVTQKWENINITTDIIEDLEMSTAEIIIPKQNTAGGDIVLAIPANSEIGKVTAKKGLFWKKVKVLTNDLGQKYVKVKPGSVLKYDFKYPDPMPALPDVEHQQYDSYLKTVSEDVKEKLGHKETDALPIEALEYIKDLEKFSITEKVMKIENRVRENGFYDNNEGAENPLYEQKKGANLKERIKLCEMRVAMLPDASGRLFAGVCADASIITTLMLREAGILAGISGGYSASSNTITTNQAHATSFVLLPGGNNKQHMFVVDGTFSSARSVDDMLNMMPDIAQESLEQQNKEQKEIKAHQVEEQYEDAIAVDPQKFVHNINKNNKALLKHSLQKELDELSWGEWQNIKELAYSYRFSYGTARGTTFRSFADKMLDGHGKIDTEKKWLSENRRKYRKKGGLSMDELLRIGKESFNDDLGQKYMRQLTGFVNALQTTDKITQKEHNILTLLMKYFNKGKRKLPHE